MSVNEYKIVKKAAQGEITEKKSRFIANVIPVTSTEMAEQEIARISKEYWDARHNCYAFIIGEKSELSRCSDNGEPSGTAGKPILEVIKGSGLTNVLIVVTRYFGGVLLGTGGLVRAYTQAAQAGLANSEIATMKKAVPLKLKLGYDMINTVQYYLRQEEITVSREEYGADVEMDIMVEADLSSKISDDLIQKTNAKIEITKGDETYYAF
ncbi:MAG: YigZ family protein [Butyrivibrio sp.]|nr:YigZ family protein [Butyrivibrio sp.]